MVSDIPLPPKQFTDPNQVLATPTPSPAPTPPAPKSVAAPVPDAIPIPVKSAKPTKVADRTQAPPLHPPPVAPQPNKAATGEGPAPQIAMSTTQTRAGTFGVGVSDATFGVRFGYYNEQIKRKLMSEWYTTLLDKQATGHRVYISFQVARDGSVSHIQIAQSSGDPTLDRVSLSAVQHVDTFGPLPDAYQGSYIGVMYYFEAP
jgi:protein TonB